MDHISRISIFLTVVKHQSFAGAARSMGMTGPALSKQVQALEDQLGVRLLHRTTRQISLTEEGEIFHNRARIALDDLDEVERQIQDLKSSPTGHLKVNVPTTFGKQYLTKPIAAFVKAYPEVQMEIDFDDRKVDVIGEGYDVVVRIGTLEDSSLIARQLAPCPIILCASPAFLSHHGIPEIPNELLKLPAVLFSKHGNINEWRHIDENGVKGSTELNKVFATDSAEMMLEACLEGIGVAVLPIFSVATYLDSNQLVRVLPQYHTDPELIIHAIFPQNRHLSAKVRLFVDWLSNSCKALPW
ncbi:MAG: LysR family transcriptional regulator [Sneathiella sp.]